jgi:hypothetical protein
MVEGELPKPHWSWGRDAVDFIREDGQWKIWHVHVLTTFRTPYDQDWVDSAVNRPPYLPDEGTTLEGVGAPTRPMMFNQLCHPEAAPAYQPEPPEPCSTWTEVRSYTDPPHSHVS